MRVFLLVLFLLIQLVFAPLQGCLADTDSRAASATTAVSSNLPSIRLSGGSTTIAAYGQSQSFTLTLPSTVTHTVRIDFTCIVGSIDSVRISSGKLSTTFVYRASRDDYRNYVESCSYQASDNDANAYSASAPFNITVGSPVRLQWSPAVSSSFEVYPQQTFDTGAVASSASFADPAFFQLQCVGGYMWTANSYIRMTPGQTTATYVLDGRFSSTKITPPPWEAGSHVRCYWLPLAGFGVRNATSDTTMTTRSAKHFSISTLCQLMSKILFISNACVFDAKGEAQVDSYGVPIFNKEWQERAAQFLLPPPLNFTVLQPSPIRFTGPSAAIPFNTDFTMAIQLTAPVVGTGLEVTIQCMQPVNLYPNSTTIHLPPSTTTPPVIQIYARTGNTASAAASCTYTLTQSGTSWYRFQVDGSLAVSVGEAPQLIPNGEWPTSLAIGQSWTLVLTPSASVPTPTSVRMTCSIVNGYDYVMDSDVIQPGSTTPIQLTYIRKYMLDGYRETCRVQLTMSTSFLLQMPLEASWIVGQLGSYLVTVPAVLDLSTSDSGVVDLFVLPSKKSSDGMQVWWGLGVVCTPAAAVTIEIMNPSDVQSNDGVLRWSRQQDLSERHVRLHVQKDQFLQQASPTINCTWTPQDLLFAAPPPTVITVQLEASAFSTGAETPGNPVGESGSSTAASSEGPFTSSGGGSSDNSANDTSTGESDSSTGSDDSDFSSSSSEPVTASTSTGGSVRRSSSSSTGTSNSPGSGVTAVTAEGINQGSSTGSDSGLVSGSTPNLSSNDASSARISLLETLPIVMSAVLATLALHARV